MTFGSVCSGVEAASLAWHPLGWRAAFYSEIEAFPRAVLRHRFPSVPVHGDFTTIKAGEYEPIDLLVGGTPCQDFSVAGRGAGLGGIRGQLSLEFPRVARRLGARWFVWENVPNVMSLGGGWCFGAIIGEMVRCGYGVAWRLLDAQFAGLAQRRKRVFVVGHLGDERRAQAVLFESPRVSWNPPPRREAGQRVAGTFSSGAHPGGYNGQDATSDMLVTGTLGASHGNIRGDEAWTGRLIPERERALTSSNQRIDAETETLIPVAFNWQGGGTQTTLGADSEKTGALHVGQVPAVAFHENQRAELTLNDTAGSLKTSGGKPGQGYPAVQAGGSVRRLTPRECERLQGMPDDWTLVPYRGKPASDGPRYRAIGNSMAVPCMAWIGERIQTVEAIP